MSDKNKHSKGLRDSLDIFQRHNGEIVELVKNTRVGATYKLIIAAWLRGENVLLLVPNNFMASTLPDKILSVFNMFYRNWTGYKPIYKTQILFIGSNDIDCQQIQELRGTDSRLENLVLFRHCKKCQYKRTCSLRRKLMVVNPRLVILTADKLATVYMPGMTMPLPPKENHTPSISWQIHEHINHCKVRIADEYDLAILNTNEFFKLDDISRCFTRDVNDEYSRLKTELEEIYDTDDEEKIAVVESKVDFCENLSMFFDEAKRAIPPCRLRRNWSFNFPLIQNWIVDMIREGSRCMTFAKATQVLSSGKYFILWVNDDKETILTPLTGAKMNAIRVVLDAPNVTGALVSASEPIEATKKSFGFKKNVTQVVWEDYFKTERSMLVIADTRSYSPKSMEKRFYDVMAEWKGDIDIAYEWFGTNIDIRFKNKSIRRKFEDSGWVKQDSLLRHFYDDQSVGVQAEGNCRHMLWIGSPHIPVGSMFVEVLKTLVWAQREKAKERVAMRMKETYWDTDNLAYIDEMIENEMERDFEQLDRSFTKMEYIGEEEAKRRAIIISNAAKQTLGRVKSPNAKVRSWCICSHTTETELRKNFITWKGDRPYIVGPISQKEKYTRFIMARLWDLGFPEDCISDLPILARVIDIAMVDKSSVAPSKVANVSGLTSDKVKGIMKKHKRYLENFGLKLENGSNICRVVHV